MPVMGNILRNRLGALAVVLFASGSMACVGGSGGEKLDSEYRTIHHDLMTAYRDTARNVRNREARGRKTAAEQARLAFFQDPDVVAAIEEARSAPKGTLDWARGEAYYRQQVVASVWKEAEKAEETKILGRLEEARARTASWTSADGTLNLSLDESWDRLALRTAELSDEERSDLAEQYAGHRMRLVNGDLQRLVELRNSVANRAGFATYWELALAGHGLDPAEVDRIIEEISTVVTPLNKAIVAREEAAAKKTKMARTFANQPLLRQAAGLTNKTVDPDTWFDGDLAEERITQALSEMGIETVGWSVFSGPSRYVRPGAFAFPVRPPDQVSIVMSIDRRWSLWNYEALAHEGAFAVWWTNMSPDVVGTPPLWGPPAPWFEGFAQFFERLVTEPAFTERYVTDLPAELREDLSRQRARDMLGIINDSLIRTVAERRLYESPADLSAVCEFTRMERVRRVGVPEPPSTDQGLAYDASLLSPILWNYPAYSPNFLFSYMAEAWIYDAVVAQVGDPVGNPKVGPLLVDKVVQGAPGTSIPERLSALLPGDRTAPLRRYLERAALDPTTP